MEAEIPHVRKVRDAALLLSCSALSHSIANDHYAAERDLLCLARIHTALKDDLTAISQLVRFAIEGILAGAVQDYLHRFAPSRAFAENLRAALPQGGNILQTAYMGEMLAFRTMVARTYKLPLNPFRGIFDNRPYTAWQSLKGNFALGYLDLINLDEWELGAWAEFLTALHGLAGRDWSDAETEWNEWEEYGNTLAGEPNTFIKILMPAILRVDDAARRMDGINRILSVACALEVYRSERGHMPEDLGYLVPEFLSVMPLDPFDGKPIRYVQLPDGYRLYSIWEDKEDDGGISDTDSLYTGKSELDCVLTVQRPDLADPTIGV